MAFRVKRGSVRVTPSAVARRPLKTIQQRLGIVETKRETRPKKGLRAEEERREFRRRPRQTHENNFTEKDIKDVHDGKLFFKHYVNSEALLPETRVALNALLPAITRFKSLLQAQVPAIRNPDYPPDRVIEQYLQTPPTEMYHEASILQLQLQMARQKIGGFEDRHAYGMIKDIWMPQKMRKTQE
ncbi:MAG: hypothetical protein HY544_01465 [Candidatus Diapherotrites archaeon]|uniref:Uncharacterized protein n=1 Tax=Candidatus Iainarchaeum sp. TaxID=3101447 RepID=A0A8T3YKE4_9ARCH|nr:hypothetical protein [Candidatus Diapherotrites archaeon]